MGCLEGGTGKAVGCTGAGTGTAVGSCEDGKCEALGGGCAGAGTGTAMGCGWGGAGAGTGTAVGWRGGGRASGNCGGGAEVVTGLVAGAVAGFCSWSGEGAGAGTLGACMETAALDTGHSLHCDGAKSALVSLLAGTMSTRDGLIDASLISPWDGPIRLICDRFCSEEWSLTNGELRAITGMTEREAEAKWNFGGRVKRPARTGLRPGQQAAQAVEARVGEPGFVGVASAAAVDPALGHVAVAGTAAVAAEAGWVRVWGSGPVVGGKSGFVRMLEGRELPCKGRGSGCRPWSRWLP